MLAIYLHHDSSVLTNVFCTQALCADSIVGFLNENFVNFGWDLTHQSNRDRAVRMLTEHFGSVAAATVRNLDVERFPMLALVYRLRGTMEIFQVIHGNVTLDELMSQLLAAVDTYADQITVEIREEEAREARNAVKAEQDLAFEMAERADREKEERKKREEAEREAKEREEAARKADEEAAKNRVMEKAKAKLPAEPKAGGKNVARIRFRVVGGRQNLERRFLASDRLELLFDFITAEGFEPETHKVLTSFPRRDVSNYNYI